MANTIYDRIRNIKSSLDLAEESFRRNNGMRGELDLMLAEAEMKHLREKRGLIYGWNRQRLAVLVAAMLLLAGYGGWLYAGYDTTPNPVAQQQVVQLAEKKADTEVVVDKQNVLILPRQETEPAHNDILPRQAAPQSVPMLNKGEMQQLVRAGRQALRESN